MGRRTATSSSIREFPLIRQLQRRFERGHPSIVKGIGDDAAVVALPPKSWTILTTDLLAEGVHFDLRTADMASVGFRAAMANLSDVAAMGAQPRFLLVALAIPGTLRASDITHLYRGLMQACSGAGVHLIGGDTSASRHGLFLSITLVGTAPPKHALFRHGARIGDRLYVTGTLGDSLAGLQLLSHTEQRASRRRLSAAHRRFLVDRHLRPTARVAEGRWLARSGLATAAMDVSDGLSGDLRHLCEESGVGACVETALLPLSPACQAYGLVHDIDPVTLALAGGGDYELLCTARPQDEPALMRQAARQGFQITRIGEICPRRVGITTRLTDGRTHPLPVTSYRHFE